MGSDDGVAGLGLPGWRSRGRGRRLERQAHLGAGHQFGLFRRKVSAEVGGEGGLGDEEDAVRGRLHQRAGRRHLGADAIPKRSPAKPMMEAVLNRAEDVLVEGRDRVRDLRSEEEGLALLFDEIERLIFGLERDGCGPIEVRSSGPPRPLNIDAQREILAIAKEALTNACRHSRASAIYWHVIFTGSHVRLICGDNGVGIDVTTMKVGGRAGHWSLPGMQERARQIGGALCMRSMPGESRIEFSMNTRLAYLRSIRRRLLLFAGQ